MNTNTLDLVCHITIWHCRATGSPVAEPASSAPVTRRSVLENPRLYLRRHVSSSELPTPKQKTASASDILSSTGIDSDSEDYLGPTKRGKRRALSVSTDTWDLDQNGSGGGGEVGEGDGDGDVAVWDRYQDLQSVDVELEDTGTNFASVGLNYTITFLIQSYGACHTTALYCYNCLMRMHTQMQMFHMLVSSSLLHCG